eukprot:TRINITY_DN33796_c0_g1_i1.p1 TRINITY_DN33796_c0_g1~~TRINITY_DN33796_c0_g1_i1.p1  ORF type:complete len:202 (+),score=22.21 TRINITY_DN33796_c0_g1_i1:70-675(+)
MAGQIEDLRKDEIIIGQSVRESGRERSSSTASTDSGGSQTSKYVGNMARRSTGGMMSFMKSKRSEGNPPPHCLRRRPYWQEDSSWGTCCELACKKRFGIMTRKHHCRGCGFIFCSLHCSQHTAISEFGYTSARVCDNCCFSLSKGEDPKKLCENARVILQGSICSSIYSKPRNKRNSVAPSNRSVSHSRTSQSQSPERKDR